MGIGTADIREIWGAIVSSGPAGVLVMLLILYAVVFASVLVYKERRKLGAFLGPYAGRVLGVIVRRLELAVEKKS